MISELPVGDNPSLGMACNVYRRLHGSWPDAVRFAPGHFAGYIRGLDDDQITLLATVFIVTVTAEEKSPRLTVMGPHGAVTYGHGIEDEDHDLSPFHEWLHLEAHQRGLTT